MTFQIFYTFVFLMVWICQVVAFPELSINPELNKVLRGSEGRVQEALKNELIHNLNNTFKQLEDTFDDCSKFSTNLTKLIGEVLV